MVELLCAERIVDLVAETDPVIFHDSRVLDNLISHGFQYVPRCNYFHHVQTDIKPFMRKVVATWMMEVCEEERCEDQVFSTAVNLLDRFLCECHVAKAQLQMVACVCLLVASKVRQCHALSISRLEYFTENSVSAEEIRQFEVLLMCKLKGDLNAITGFDYVDHVLERLSWPGDKSLVRRHARTLVDLCYTEPALYRKSPALIASGCLLAAARGLHVHAATATSVCDLTLCRAEDVEHAVAYIESLMDSHQPAPERPPPPPAPAKHAASPAAEDADVDDPRYPETPTDVQEIFF